MKLVEVKKVWLRDVWPRKLVNLKKAMRFVKNTEIMGKPILVARVVDKKKYVVLDGHNRLTAHYLLGKKKVLVKVFCWQEKAVFRNGMPILRGGKGYG